MKYHSVVFPVYFDFQLNESGPLDNRSTLSLRVFGRDVFYLEDIENSDLLAKLLERQPDFVDVNETLGFSTSGGLMVQANDLLVASQDVEYYHGMDAKYGINIR